MLIYLFSCTYILIYICIDMSMYGSLRCVAISVVEAFVWP